MKSITTFLLSISLLIAFTCLAQIKNNKTEVVKIYGNCNTCKTNIEKAANIKKIVKSDWNKDSKMATISFDNKVTNLDEILKRIALAGYDSDKFLAPDKAYFKLDACCHYNREKKTKIDLVKSEVVKEPIIVNDQKNSELTNVFEAYFDLKNAFVKSDANSVLEKSKIMLSNYNSIIASKLTNEEQMVWVKESENLNIKLKSISSTIDIELQRASFIQLSVSVFELLKVSKMEISIYYQNCPMANDGKGANWLSKENVIKNPYFGNTMLSCGKTIETIK